ncbi:MAG TPA: MFS transporter [Dehalococcoidales bacterium]|nr:MFS transporter [Dehalococcoidales bacterium]
MESHNSPSLRPPPRFFYGYVMVAAAFCIMLVYSAARTVFGIFFEPMVTQFGWSAAMLSGAFSLSIVMDGTMGILWGRLTDKLGPKKILFLCGTMAGAGYILLFWVDAIWQMYLIYGVLIGAGMGGIFVPLSAALPRWFVARRAMANGIALVGIGVGTLIMSPIAYWLVTSYGWPTSYVVIGSVFLVVVLISTIFIKNDPSEVGQKPYTGSGQKNAVNRAAVRDFTLNEAIHTRQMWLTFVMFFCFGFAAMSMMVHLVPHIINIEISAATAASVLAVVGAVNVLGRLAFGLIGDKLGSLQTYRMGFIMIIFSLAYLLFIRESWMLYVFAVLWGFSAGGMGSVHTPIIAELFGIKALGAIFGVCGLGVMIGGSVGPVIIGLLFDQQENYQVAFALCLAFAVLGTILNIWLTRMQKRLTGVN